MATYTPTIGLEIHAELKTQTKMFCDSRNDPEETRPNTNVCPICMGHPGTLPTVNKEAVRHVLRVGLALNGALADYTEFDRKNYFYPDIPKGYQISQYKHPLVSGGMLNNVEITRVHLEEDTARSIHDQGAYSLVDFNRAGVPLMELVTEPVIRDAKEAGDFARELQLLLRTLGASDANVSVSADIQKGLNRPEGVVGRTGLQSKPVLGTKVEIKNLNSFRAVERAIAYEVKRQTEVLEKGGRVVQETRGWDENKQKTFSQRVKEESHDYRYFPDPDIPKYVLSELEDFSHTVLQQGLPELPWQKRKRYIERFQLKEEIANLFVQNEQLGSFFEKVSHSVQEDAECVLLAANYIASDLTSLIKTNAESAIAIMPEDFAQLIIMTKKGEVSSRGAKDILVALYEGEREPQRIAARRNLFQQSDLEALREMAEKIIESEPVAVEELKNGKESALQYLVGQGMKESKGSANPQALKEIFTTLLK